MSDNRASCEELPASSKAGARTESRSSLYEDDVPQSARSDGADTPDVGEMDNEQRDRLRLTRDHIVLRLQTGHVLDHLLQERVISDRDVDEIMDPENDTKQRASVLLEILPRRGARAFKVFRDSLLLCEAADYSDLVTELDRVVVGGTGMLQKDDRIQVVIRVRPLRGEEKEQEEGCLTVDTRLMQISVPTMNNGVQQFIFNKVFPEETTQAEIFNTMASPIVDAVLEGYNGCILCYGKTGSGKTYTMAGPSDRDLNEKTEGIIYRALKQLFLKSQKKKDWNIAFFVSVLEIYNEKVFDLTVPRKERPSLDIREDPSNSLFFANNLEKHNITNAMDAIRVFFEASASRRSRATEVNERSSRSHMVFQVVVSILHKEGTESGRTGELYLVDLAGSETAGEVNKDAEGLREGANINMSLLHLKEVIRDLSVKNRQDFKFRRSSLTMLLKRVLTGNSKTAFIVNVDPSKKSLRDTRRSLDFASDAKKVKVKPKINYSPLESLLIKYLKDIGDLKRQIKTMKKSRKKSADGKKLRSARKTSDVGTEAEVDTASLTSESKESFDVDRVRELVNFSVTNTAQDFRAKLDGLLEEERREIKDEISAQLKGFQQTVQEKSEQEAQQAKESVVTTDKLLEEVHSKQQQVLDEQLQTRQLLTDIKERTAEEHTRDDTSGQLSDHVQQMNLAMEDLRTLNRELRYEMESHLENIRQDMRNRDDITDKSYHEEFKKLQTNYADLKIEINFLAQAFKEQAKAAEERRAQDETEATATDGDTQTVKPNHGSRTSTPPHRDPLSSLEAGTETSCCECCEVCCTGTWYRRPGYAWFSVRGKGAGWVTLLVMFHLLLCLPIFPIILFYFYTRRYYQETSRLHPTGESPMKEDGETMSRAIQDS
ncbi:kinesin-like protein KIF3A [Branchiostoma floridae]|uniref:Kinesin-like protein n=1 Tax=Branchiostoma floridae TaxID=7739 RepID=A0A9J7N655_BRAFL|nr:kinesin-like protein KIF3A [Branchiostoma floridae]